MPTTTRIDKDPNNRLDASFMNNFHDEVDVERRLMLFCQHHRNCNTKYQDTIAYRRLAEEQKSKALIDKVRETSKKEAISLSQDKSSKPKASTVKPEQQQANSDHSKSQQASLPDSNKESFSSEHKQELCDPSIQSSLSAAINRNISPLSGVVKQEEGGSSSSSCVHRPTETVSKSSPLDLSSHQQHIHQNMGVCDSNGTSPYSEVKNTSNSSRKGSLGNMTFVGLSGNPDDELNLNAKDFIENTAITLLPSVDADNQPDPLPMKKPAEPRSSLPQQQQSLHSSSNRNDDVLPPTHENDVERGMTEFSKVMDLVIKREEGAATQSSRHNSGSSFGQLSDLRLQASSSNDDLTNGTGSSPPPYPGTSGSALKRAAQQLASTKDKYLQQQMASHTANPTGTQSQPTPTPIPPAATAETNWQQQQQQQLMAAKQQQQQQMIAAHQMQQQQQNKMRGKMQQQTQQQQLDIFKSASPNVTIVSRDTYRSTAMTMQQQSPNVAVHPSSMAAMNHQVHMIHANTQSVQTMGQPSLMHQHQQPVTISMSRNQPQVYAPMPSAGPYVGAAVDPHTVNRSNSIAFSGIESQHLYQQQQRRHSLPPQIPSAVHQGHWQQQQQDLLIDGGYSSVVTADAHHPYSMAGQKRCQSYLPPQVAVAKRNSFQHMPVSHAMVQASYQQQQQQPHTNTMINGEMGQPMYNGSMVDPLMSFDGRGDLFGAPL